MKHRIFSVILLLFVTTKVQSQEVNWGAIHGLGEVKYHRLDSKVIEQTYHIFISLPDGYSENEKYPVIYLLDGGWTFPALASFYHYLRNGDETPQCILVGISYGTSDWQKGNQRNRDFTAKSAEREYWGGAVNFQKVISEEIFPLIETSYPANPENRILFGQSLGGQFVLHTAMTKPEMFAGYIASNPALHRNLDFFLDHKNLNPPEKAIRLFVASGSNDDPTFRKPAVTWISHWTKENPWQLKTITLEGHNHFSAVPEAFLQGVRWVFLEK